MERGATTMMVARNIEVLMEARGLDPARLARMSKVNPTGVYDILSGKSRNPTIETIAKIARGLGVPTAALFEEQSLADLRLDLLTVFDGLTAEQRRLLVQTAQAWVSSEAARA